MNIIYFEKYIPRYEQNIVKHYKDNIKYLYHFKNFEILCIFIVF